DNNVQPVFTGQPSFGPHGVMIPPGYRWEDSIAPEGFRMIPAGSTLQIVSDVRMDWIVNIAPLGTVERVWAWRSLNNVRALSIVPSRYWRQDVQDYPDTLQDTRGGRLTATTVVLRRPLSGYAFEGWEDQIYVDMDCAIPGQIGPVMEYLIAQ